MATAKKRTTKTAAAKTAATKTPQSGKQSSKKTAGKAAAAKPGKKTSAQAPALEPDEKKAGQNRGKASGKASEKKAAAAKAGAKTRGKEGKDTVLEASAPFKRAKPSAKADRSRDRAEEALSDPSLFEPLTEGERADALRTLTQDHRLAGMAEVGRYRVIAVEPLAVKPPHRLSSKRLARLAIYDYANDRSVDACVDLDAGNIAYLHISRAQPMLSRGEEAAAISIAMSDERVKNILSLGDEPQVAMHYWSTKDTNLSFARRSAAVLFGPPGNRPTLVAVVDLLDNLVCEIVPGSQW